jgi:AraC family transcriptional regulator
MGEGDRTSGTPEGKRWSRGFAAAAVLPRGTGGDHRARSRVDSPSGTAEALLRGKLRLSDRGGVPDAGAGQSCNPQLSQDVRGLSMFWMFESPTACIAEYLCQSRVPGLTADREQFWNTIAFPLSGQYVLHLTGETINVDPTCVAFFNPGKVYRTSHPCGTGDRGVLLVIQPSVLRELMTRYDPTAADQADRVFPFSRGYVGSRVSFLMSLLVRTLASPFEESLAVEELSLHLANAALAAGYRHAAARPSTRPRAANRRREKLEAVKKMLARLPGNRWRLSHLAAAVDLSPFHLCRLFVSETGMSIGSYVRRLKLSAALERLLDGQRDLSDMALDLGFASHSHFAADFRRVYHVTPSEVRRFGHVLRMGRRLGRAVRVGR